MRKLLLFCFALMLGIDSMCAGELNEVIPVDEGQIDYFIFIDKGYGITDPHTFEWSKGVDSSGDEYILAINQSSTFPTYYYFYNLDEESLDSEYDYWLSHSMELLRDDDNETTGSINEDYIFCKMKNTDKDTYPYGDYIGHKFYFTDMQRIPYSKFNMVWESGGLVMDY